MGTLKQSGDGQTLELEAETTVGRSPRSTFRLCHLFVSGQHACVRWSGEGWHIRDLGSRNGTWVDGQRVPEGGHAKLRLNSQVCFGNLDETWRLVDDAPPRPMLRPLLGGRPIVVSLAPASLPSEDNTQASVFLKDGSVMVETESETRVLGNGEVCAIGGGVYTASLPQIEGPTEHAAAVCLRVGNSQLCMRPSLHEEHVGASITVAGEPRELRARLHNHLLLLLVRQRLADQADSVPPGEEGWLGADEVCRRLRIDRTQLATAVYRIRRQFATVGLEDPANIVQRRPDSRELRVGVRNVSIAAE